MKVESSENSSYNWIIDSRQKLMGLAAIWIILYHSTIPLTGLFGFIKSIGYAGVDLFFFLSGISMKKSYTITSNKKVFLFYRKRVFRIIPEYCLILGIELMIIMIKHQFNGYGLAQIIQNVFMIRWYVVAISIFYLVTPVIEYIEEKNNKCIFAVLGVITIIIYLLSLGKSSILIMLLRFPNAIFGYFTNEHNKIFNINNTLFEMINLCIVLSGLMMMSFLFHRCTTQVLTDFGMYWVPFIIITYPLINLLSWLMHIMKANLNIIKYIGSYSLELYMLHPILLRIVSGLCNNILVINFLAIILAVSLCPCLNGINKKIGVAFQKMER